MKSTPIIVMDFDLNIIKECESVRAMVREFGNNEHNLGGHEFKLLKEGYLVKFYDTLIIKKEFYDKNNDFKYTLPARNSCTKVRTGRQQNRLNVLKNEFNRRIAILNDDYTIKEVIMCSMEDLAERFNVTEGTVKSNLSRAPEALYKMAIGKSWGTRKEFYIHMRNYNQLIKRITEYKKAHENALDVFSKI